MDELTYIHCKYVGLMPLWLDGIQHAMYVKNADWCGVCVAGPEREIIMMDIGRDEQLISSMATACDRWWYEYFEPNKLPPAIPLGKTCHLCAWRITCQPGIYNAKELSYDPVINDAMRYHFILQDITEKVNLAKALVDGKLSSTIKDSSKVKTVYGSIEHVKKRRLLLNSQKILAAYPDVREKYTTATESVELSLTPWFAEASTEIPDAPSS